MIFQNKFNQYNNKNLNYNYKICIFKQNFNNKKQIYKKNFKIKLMNLYNKIMILFNQLNQ